MSNPASLSALLGDAGLDEAATQAMNLTVDTLGPAITAGLGTVTLDDIGSSEVLLVSSVIDDSSSIEAEDNTKNVIDGTNKIPEDLKASKQAGDVLISCQFLNHGVLYPYRPLDGAIALDRNNYMPYGNTPLYDRTAIVLTGLVAKMAEFENGGVAARAVTVIVTDGADVGSRVHTAKSIKPIIQELIRSEQHIIIGMGIDDCPKRCPNCDRDNVKSPIPIGQNNCPTCGTHFYRTNFQEVFTEMGMLPKWILTPASTSHEVRQAFAVVSQSAVRASQVAGGSFSQVALGGFNTTP